MKFTCPLCYVTWEGDESTAYRHLKGKRHKKRTRDLADFIGLDNLQTAVEHIDDTSWVLAISVIGCRVRVVLTDQQCPICLKIGATDMPESPCGCRMAYHSECLHRWYAENGPSCPVCRKYPPCAVCHDTTTRTRMVPHCVNGCADFYHPECWAMHDRRWRDFTGNDSATCPTCRAPVSHDSGTLFAEIPKQLYNHVRCVGRVLFNVLVNKVDSVMSPQECEKYWRSVDYHSLPRVNFPFDLVP